MKRHPIYTVTIKQAEYLPSRFGYFSRLAPARRAAVQSGAQLIAKVVDSNKRHVAYCVTSPAFSVADLRACIEESYREHRGVEIQVGRGR